MDFRSASRQLTKDRSERKHSSRTAKGRRRRALEKPAFQAAARPYFQHLIDFLDGKLKQKPIPAKPWLRGLIEGCGLQSEDLALMMLAPLMNGLDYGWDGRDGPSASMLLKMQMGRELCHRISLEHLKRSKDKKDRDTVHKRRKRPKAFWARINSDWNPEAYVRAGNWMMTNCAMVLNCFVINEHGVPEVRTDCRIEVDALRQELMWRDQVHAPHYTKPPPWISPVTEYDDRLRVEFVSDPETRAATAKAFEDPEWEHAKAISALRRVAHTIDPVMRDLVQEFAVDIIASRPTKSRTPREDAERLVTADILRAKEIGDRPFYVDHFCDWRGRAYGVQRLNYQRQDHVRSLFRFERGKPLCADQVEIIADRDRFLRGEDWYGGAVVGSPLHWLEIHVANSYGEVDKMPMRDRLKWVDGQRDTIKKIARDPFGTKELWIGAEKKFAFVAACRELTAAMEDPRHFETCLPIGFDGTCNGIQHLALLCRDEETARRVSLVDDNDVIHDIYGEVASLVRAQINVDDDEWAEYWRNEFKKFKDREIRKLFKQPVMTLPYGVTEEGAVQQIVEDYFELLNKYNRRCPVVLDAKGRPIGGRYGYLAKKIMAVAADLMAKPMQVMEFIKKLSAHFALQNLSLEWISPTGFPATNRYYAPDVKEVALFHGGERIRRHDVARGYLPTVMIDEATRSAAPNFIHSMDAAHLVRVVNAAAEEDIETACVHDSFSCLAPDADRFNKIIRSQLAMLYVRQDHLRALRDYSAVRHSSINLSLSALRKLKLANFAKAHPLPAYGSHDPITVQDAKYCWA